MISVNGLTVEFSGRFQHKQIFKAINLLLLLRQIKNALYDFSKWLNC